jgi:predicted alpha/beta superfamily hydrolase
MSSSNQDKRMGRSRLFCLGLLGLHIISLSHYGQDREARSDTQIVIGETITVPSRHLDRTMTVDVCLPPDYAITDTRYPLLLTCQSHFLLISGIAAHMARRGAAPEMIVVGVRNYASDDLIPEKIDGHPLSGGADRFIAFFRDELIPCVDRRYRTRPFHIFYSGSFGGGFAVYAMLTHPDVFNACLAATPAIDYEGGSSLIMRSAPAWLAKTKDAHQPRFLYMGVENDPRLIPLLERFSTLLVRAAPPGWQWRYRPFPEEDHVSIVNAVVHHGLHFVFSAANVIPPDVIARGADAIREYSAGLRSTFAYDIGLTDIAFHRAFMFFRKQKRFDDAIGLLRVQLHQRPDAEMTWLNLGRAFEANGQLLEARLALRQAHAKAMANGSSHLGIFVVALERVEQQLAKKKDPPDGMK